MTVAELIEQLSKLDQTLRVGVGVYDCGGYNDWHDIEVGEPYDESHMVQLEISVGCASHRKWATEGNCPVNRAQIEIKKVEDAQKSLERIKQQMVEQEERLSKRNRKE